jgi:hypothetical protein
MGRVWLRLAGGERPSEELERACRRLGGTMTLRRGAGGGLLTIAVPHDRLDVFGLLHLISQHVDGASAPGSDCAAPAVARRSHGELVTAHHWTTRRVTPKAVGRTVTQQILRRLLPSLRANRVTHTAVVVGGLGHRFRAVELKMEELAELTATRGGEWVRKLRTRARLEAERVLRPLHRLPPPRAQVTFSSGGNFDRFSWAAPAITPGRLQAITPPWRPQAMNLYAWSRAGRQAISFCGHADHPLWSAEAALTAAWQSAFD